MGRVSGSDNRFDQYDSNGDVTIYTEGSVNTTGDSAIASRGHGGLGIGHEGGTNNTLTQTDVEGSVNVTTVGDGFVNFINLGTGDGLGSRGQGGLGIGFEEGISNTLTQSNVKGEVTVTTTGSGIGSVGDGSGGRGHGGLGIGLHTGTSNTLAQTDVEGIVTVNTVGNGTVVFALGGWPWQSRPGRVRNRV